MKHLLSIAFVLAVGCGSNYLTRDRGFRELLKVEDNYRDSMRYYGAREDNPSDTVKFNRMMYIYYADLWAEAMENSMIYRDSLIHRHNINTIILACDTVYIHDTVYVYYLNRYAKSKSSVKTSGHNSPAVVSEKEVIIKY